jgi:hypothetical protein
MKTQEQLEILYREVKETMEKLDYDLLRFDGRILALERQVGISE